MLEHLKSRGLRNPEFYNVSWDEFEIVFPLYTLTGLHKGNLRYRPLGTKKDKTPEEAKYVPSRSRGSTVLFGTQTFNWLGPIYLVEGVFKAVKLHNLGFASFALLGSDLNFYWPQLRILRHTKELIAIGDNDPAGERFVQQLGEGFTSPRDLDEMTDEEVLWLLKS